MVDGWWRLGVEGSGHMEKGLKVMDNSAMIVVGEGVGEDGRGCEGGNGDGKNTVPINY